MVVVRKLKIASKYRKPKKLPFLGHFWRFLAHFDQKIDQKWPKIDQKIENFITKVRKNHDVKKRIFRPISPFLKKLEHFLCFQLKMSLMTTKTSLPFLQTQLAKRNFS